VSALQVKYQPLPVNNAQEQQAVDVMKGLAAQYLQVDPNLRPPAWYIQSELFDVMKVNGWSNSLMNANSWISRLMNGSAA